MPIRLTFLGAAENVTGARYLLEVGARRLLVDCGLYQERDLAARNWDPFPVPPATLDAVLLTHAHLDHSGYLPRLVRDGFRGPIYCTQATAEIAQIALQDSASLQVEDAKLKLKRHEREGRTPPHPEIPLYEAADVAACCALVHPVTYNDPVTPVPGVEATFQEVGHILGAAMIRLRMRTDGTERSLLFSGDIGRWNRPIIRDPQLCPPSDYVVMESTYGDRLHEDPGSIADLLCRTICATRERGGNILIPSFAIERAQDVLYYLNELLQAQRIPHLLVFVDSPMAVSVSEVFEHHRELLEVHPLVLQPYLGAVAVPLQGPADGPQRGGLESHQPHQGHGSDHRRLRHVHGWPHQAPPRAEYRVTCQLDPVRGLPGGRDPGAGHRERCTRGPHPGRTAPREGVRRGAPRFLGARGPGRTAALGAAARRCAAAPRVRQPR